MLDLAQLHAAEHTRAFAPLGGPLPAIDPAVVLCRVTIRGEAQTWQRPLIPHARISEYEQRRLADELLRSTDPPYETIRRWAEEHNRQVRTVTPQQTLQAEEMVRAFIRSDMDINGQQLAEGIAFGLRARFYTNIGLTRADLDNYLGILYEAGTGALYKDDSQIIEGAQWKIIRSDDPRTEAIWYAAGYYR